MRFISNLNDISISGLIYYFMQIFTNLLSLHSNTESYIDNFKTIFEDKNEIFDFIIVGGGVSGSVLANRLSEEYNVLLLELGGTFPEILKIPTLAFNSFGRHPVDYKFKTVPQLASSFGLNNNQTSWPSGKGLGGSSGINGLFYIRGNVQGFEQIANETGDHIWKLENVLKYFRNIEDYNGHFNNINHGKDGPQSIEGGDLSPFIDYFLKAGEELGYSINDPNDSFGPLKEGFAPMDFYQKNGRRWGTYDARIKPILNRKNFKIRKFSNVYKILFNENNIAIGVEYIRHGKIENAFATKEIILSTGAINSAKILTISGIGKEEELERLGIEARINLPVGEELQDKFGALIGPFTVKKGFSFLRDRDLNIGELINWVKNGKGKFASSRSEATFSICSQLQKVDEGKSVNETCYNPDIHAYIIALSIDDKSEDLADIFNIRSNIFHDYFERVKGEDAFFQFVTLSRPIGTGNLKLVDSSPSSEVLLDPKYLQNERDVQVLTEAIKLSVDLVENTKIFKEIDGKLTPGPFPGCEFHEFKSNEYYECLGRQITISAYKYCNTAPINKVVDSRFRVYGAKNLRVIDSSVLKEGVVSLNQASIQMIAEIASEFIKEEWKT